MNDQPVLTKSEAEYKVASSVRVRCLNCDMYRQRSCTLVRGEISPYAVCKHWEARK